jgi:tetratricopeptide (TPR) repeat protein
MTNILKSGAVAISLIFTTVGSAYSQSFLGMNFSGANSSDNVVQEAKVFSDSFSPWAKPFIFSLYRDGEWGAVLNFSRLGIAAIENGEIGIARKAFDEAILRVEAIYADDANAKKARSVFNEEKVKDFKGEPYERSMLYFYRALLYLHEGDYQNARASFLAADRHDSLSSAEDSTFVGAFGMMKYLAGWASSCDGDVVRSSQLIEEAQAVDPIIKAHPVKPSNSLILLDVGPAPIKWGSGKYSELLKFKAGAGDDSGYAAKTSTGIEIDKFIPAGDVTFHAMTRGGREVDGILQGKAQFKDGAAEVGSAAMDIGSQAAMFGAISNDRGTMNAGLAGMFIGLVAKGVEAATTPAADIRTWDTLPAKVMLYTAPDVSKGPVSFLINGSAKLAPLQASHGNCSFAWGRTRSAQAIESGGTAVFNANEKPVEENRAERNKLFRTMLNNELVMVNK